MARKPESLRIPAPKPQTFDRDKANRLIDQAFDSRGWLETDEFGETAQNIDKMRQAVYIAFTTDHVVTSVAAGTSRRTLKELVAERAVTKYGLYVEVFPEGPGASVSPVSEEEQAAKDFIAGDLWKLTTATNRKGWLQREVAESGLVVLEAKVFSSDPKMPAQAGRYLTDVDSAMLDFLEHKVFEDVRKKLSEADSWLATFMARNPHIALPAARKANRAIKAAVESAVHANPAFVRESLAIEAGDDDTSSDA